MENEPHSILPTTHGQPSCGWTRFWLDSVGAVIRQLGLPSFLSRFSLGAVAFAATALKRNKDLQDDKEDYATSVAWKCDTYVA